MKYDRLVLILLWREVLASLRSMRRYDLAWIGFGGALVIAYATADIAVALRAATATLRQSPWLWLAGLPVSATLLGLSVGAGVVRLSLARAYAPFMKALPVSTSDRRRMMVFATSCIGAPLTVIVVILLGLACVMIAKPNALAWALGGGARCLPSAS
ncbi:hypothetical protein LB561_27975 [Mesorhizobium sp. B292B1B]|uniref:hypothetical protein n=1 Tax=unclassified Mesorhizobium TaxID=325217 RepID=UPI001CD0FFA6|nr:MULTISPECIES: hypothetical protein [unclassified Mesorhizobium]MCA0014786.1 hypothetical protein [Mesorhizobium sp. B294B1A1]MCA0041093.1 hypothetical protein [Mesorhizobium sp. B292B1B]